MSYTLRTDKTWHQTQQELAETFEKWNIKDWETNYPRGARLSAWNQSEIDRTVRLTYWKDEKQVNLEMGKQNRAVDNLRVLYLTIEAMRMNEKRGIHEVMQSAYAQLEAPKGKKPPNEVLGIMKDAPLEVAEAAYRARANVLHPDKGGKLEEFKELNEAINEIRQANL